MQEYPEPGAPAFGTAQSKEDRSAAMPVPANFRITDDHLGEGGPKAKYAANAAAIKALKAIEAKERGATPEEQDVLSRYVGWGGIPDAFEPDKPEWAAEYAELPDWVGTMENQDGCPVNVYFNDHPEMVLGCPGVESTRYGHDYTVYPSPGADLARQLQEAVARIHGTYRPAPAPAREITQSGIDAALQAWNGDMDSKRRVVRCMKG